MSSKFFFQKNIALINLTIFKDKRGLFFESYNKSNLKGDVFKDKKSITLPKRKPKM